MGAVLGLMSGSSVLCGACQALSCLSNLAFSCCGQVRARSWAATNVVAILGLAVVQFDSLHRHPTYLRNHILRIERARLGHS